MPLLSWVGGPSVLFLLSPLLAPTFGEDRQLKGCVGDRGTDAGPTSRRTVLEWDGASNLGGWRESRGRGRQWEDPGQQDRLLWLLCRPLSVLLLFPFPPSS